MTQANLELLQHELLRHRFKFFELDPCEVPHLAVAQEFLIRFANDHGATFCVFAQPTASTAEQPIAVTLPQCSTPSQSSGAAARLKSANLSTASGPAAYLGRFCPPRRDLPVHSSSVFAEPIRRTRRAQAFCAALLSRGGVRRTSGRIKHPTRHVPSFLKRWCRSGDSSGFSRGELAVLLAVISKARR